MESVNRAAVEFIDDNVFNVKGNPLNVLRALARFSDDNHCCTVPPADLAKYGRCSEASLPQAVRDLKELGYVSIERQGGGRNNPTTYRLHFELMGEAETPVKNTPLESETYVNYTGLPDKGMQKTQVYGSERYVKNTPLIPANIETHARALTERTISKEIVLNEREKEKTVTLSSPETSNLNPSPVPSSEEIQTLFNENPEVVEAIREVCGVHPNRQTVKQRMGTYSSLLELKNLESGRGAAEVAAEVRRRFVAPAWEMLSIPNPSQIGTEWIAQGARLRHAEGLSQNQYRGRSRGQPQNAEEEAFAAQLAAVDAANYRH